MTQVLCDQFEAVLHRQTGGGELGELLIEREEIGAAQRAMRSGRQDRLDGDDAQAQRLETLRGSVDVRGIDGAGDRAAIGVLRVVCKTVYRRRHGQRSGVAHEIGSSSFGRQFRVHRGDAESAEKHFELDNCTSV